jgi:hypothetical protein
MSVNFGEIKYKETHDPIICVIERNPCEMHILNELLNSCTSFVNLKIDSFY